MHYVDVICNSEGRLYIGYTNNMNRRLDEHNRGLNRSPRSHRPWQLAYCEVYRSEKDARIRERKLKQGQTRSWLKERIQHSITLCRRS